MVGVLEGPGEIHPISLPCCAAIMIHFTGNKKSGEITFGYFLLSPKNSSVGEGGDNKYWENIPIFSQLGSNTYLDSFCAPGSGFALP